MRAPLGWRGIFGALLCVLAAPSGLEVQDIYLHEGVWQEPTQVTVTLGTTAHDTIPFEVVGVFDREGEKVEADISPTDGRLGPGARYWAKEDSLRIGDLWSILIFLPESYDCPGDAFSCPRYPEGSRLELRVRLQMPGGPYTEPRTEVRRLMLTVEDLGSL